MPRQVSRGDAPLRQPVWDLPVRLVHWLLAALIAFSWWSVHNHHTDWHIWSGCAILTLLIFRFLWGFFGSSTARWTSFVRGPRTIFSYMRGRWVGIGHNPLGALSVLALFLAVAVQVGLGLFAQDHDATSYGPLNFLVGYDTGKAVSEVHEAVFNVILALVALHLAAILYYRFVRHDNLVTPMITGRRSFDGGAAQPALAPLWKALVCALLAAAITVWISWGVPPWGARFPWDKPAEAAALDSQSYM